MGDGRWEDGAHSLDQLSSGAIEAELGLDDDEETVEPAEAQLGQMSKTRQKLEFKKIVKLTNHTISFNSLTSFEYEHHTFAGNKNAEGCLEKFVKLHYNKLM